MLLLSSNYSNEILATDTGSLEWQKCQSWNFRFCLDWLPSTFLLWKHSDQNLAIKRQNYLPSIFPSGTDRWWAGIRRGKQLYCLPTWVLKTEQTTYGRLWISCWGAHESHFKSCNAMHIMGDRKACANCYIFPKAPECKKKVHWKMRGRDWANKT